MRGLSPAREAVELWNSQIEEGYWRDWLEYKEEAGTSYMDIFGTDCGVKFEQE
jgi:hypothetical protein